MFSSLSGVYTLNSTIVIAMANTKNPVHFDDTNESVCLFLSIRRVCSSSRSLCNLIFISINGSGANWCTGLMQCSSYHFVTWITARCFPLFLAFIAIYFVFAMAAIAASGWCSNTQYFRQNNFVHTRTVLSTKPCVLKFCLSLINGIKLNMLPSH